MEAARNFLFLVFAWIVFLLGGFQFLQHEFSYAVQHQSEGNRDVVQQHHDRRSDLLEMSGQQVIGMVIYAQEGHYVLILDGISINDKTDIQNVNLRNVKDVTYQIEIVRDNNGMVSKVYATPS
ncbi:hypothetical protein [Longirhabdus pacifica]|uniref:hypothetical protein n=1 Tax=Longirhabdus pacifica TaxID=2305227 RepID=UPI001009076E|nr:hypothetical protein [Longirhabdus pacifica]